MNNNQMPALTAAQRQAAIAFNNAVIAQYEGYAIPIEQMDAEIQMLVLNCRIALAALTAQPFMYGIMDADGSAHMDECCVSTSLAGVSDSVDVLNEELTEEGEPQYKPVALFTTPVVPEDIEQDAARWRALVSSARIRILGTAGFMPVTKPGINGPSNPDFRHFGAELWTHHTGWSADKNQLGIDTLTQYADQMRALLAAPEASK